MLKDFSSLLLSHSLYLCQESNNVVACNFKMQQQLMPSNSHRNWRPSRLTRQRQCQTKLESAPTCELESQCGCELRSIQLHCRQCSVELRQCNCGLGCPNCNVKGYQGIPQTGRERKSVNLIKRSQHANIMKQLIIFTRKYSSCSFS